MPSGLFADFVRKPELACFVGCLFWLFFLEYIDFLSGFGLDGFCFFLFVRFYGLSGPIVLWSCSSWVARGTLGGGSWCPSAFGYPVVLFFHVFNDLFLFRPHLTMLKGLC